MVEIKTASKSVYIFSLVVVLIAIIGIVLLQAFCESFDKDFIFVFLCIAFGIIGLIIICYTVHSSFISFFENQRYIREKKLEDNYKIFEKLQKQDVPAGGLSSLHSEISKNILDANIKV